LCRISTPVTLIRVKVSLLDAIDRQIVHILTIEPRASFRTVADVAGISDQTAARRYRRMAESAGLRVLGVPDGSRLGWTDWFLRLQTTPGGADSIAEALARRPDTRWVHLASGGTEIICTLQARTEEQRDALFLRGLPGSRRVVQITAHSILHDFTPGPWPEAARALSPAQLEMLARGDETLIPPKPSAHGGAARPPVPLGPEDEPLLKELARDGRVLGLNEHALLWLSVEPARLEEAGNALAAHPEIPFAAATTGPTNLVASAVFRDTRHLYEYLTGELAALPGVSSVQTAPVIATLKRTGSVH